MIRNNRVLSAFAYFVLLATFNAVVFLLDPLKTVTFWIAYGFITGAFVIKIVAFFISFKGPAFERTVLGRLPLVIFSSFYLYIQFIIGVIFMLFPRVHFRITLVVHLIVLAVFLISTSLVLIFRNLVTDDGTPVAMSKKPIFVDKLSSDVFEIKSRSFAPEIQGKLDELFAAVQSSDPSTNSSLMMIEGNINNKVKLLAMCLQRSNTALANETIDEIISLLDERNQLSKTL